MFSTKFKIIGSIKCMKFNDKWIYRGRPEFSWFQKNIGASSSQKQYKWIRKTTDIWKKPERDTKKNTGFSSRRKEQKYIGTFGRTIGVRKKPKWITKGKHYIGASSSQKKDKWIRKVCPSSSMVYYILHVFISKKTNKKRAERKINI